jgi:hypothetical protein
MAKRRKEYRLLQLPHVGGLICKLVHTPAQQVGVLAMHLWASICVSCSIRYEPSEYHLS